MYTQPMISEKLTLQGHLLDKHTLSEVLDELNKLPIKFNIRKFKVGQYANDPSLVELTIQGENRDDVLEACRIAERFGATFENAEAILVEADMDGVLPENFHSTTNFRTYVLYRGQAIEVERIEMDCGIRVWEELGNWRAETCPMHKVRKGDLLVVGYDGVRVEIADDDEGDDVEFRFMSNDISSERPKRRMIAWAAAAIREARAAGKDVLIVGGPAIIHSGSAPLLAKLIEDRHITLLFAGNALAAHDIEANMLGTSLGVDLSTGHSGPHGHTHHLRAINRVRRYGSIKNAVEAGLITGGVMHTCVKTNTPFVLCGSIRDDGPLPDVITNAVDSTDTMRKYVGNVGVCLMVATMLHSVAVGNILPVWVKTFCVDTDADTVIKLTDRGTHQAIGVVTDCEFFLKELVSQLSEAV
jgi:lysine-ketoglutarate reductase/saccharopine dehydrogenase-like protein (TIGR00300 family)